jgi:hypothetical protein
VSGSMTGGEWRRRAVASPAPSSVMGWRRNPSSPTAHSEGCPSSSRLLARSRWLARSTPRRPATTATAQLRLASPPEAQAPITPEAQIVNVTIESDKKLLLTVVAAAHRPGIGRTLMYKLLGSGRIGSMRVGWRHKVPADAQARFVEQQCGGCETSLPGRVGELTSHQSGCRLDGFRWLAPRRYLSAACVQRLEIAGPELRRTMSSGM